MSEDCRKSPADCVVRRASEGLSDRGASTDEEAGAFKCPLGVSWTEHLVRHASAPMMSQVIKRGLANPSEMPHAKQLRIDLDAAWFPVDGAASKEESQWWAYLGKEGLTRDASREGWGGRPDPAEEPAYSQAGGFKLDGTSWRKF